MPKFPDRWFDYSNIGNIIEGTRIITFKVPLKESFFANNQKNQDFRFTPATLIDSINEQGLKLGLVIDLTFTKRYYDEKEFTDKGVEYKKIFVEGHVIPNQDVIEEFYQVIDKFIETSGDDSVIGVHCTHGVNRTGYVVCRYMVEHLRMKATESLEAYRIGRGYPVERINYINDLKRRAGEPVPKEDQEREDKEEKEKLQKRSKQGQQQNYQTHQDKARNSSDNRDWRNENRSYQNGRIPQENQHYQNGPRWDRNYGYHDNERMDERFDENYDYPNGQRFARNYGHYDSERLNENSYDDQYDSGSVNWGDRNGHNYDQAVTAEYHLDPNMWYGYQRPSQPQQNPGYTDGACDNNSRGPPAPPYLQDLNQYWGSGVNQELPHGYVPHIQNEGHSDNSWGNNSYDRRSYSRQNSYSGKQGRANRGSDRMKPF